MEIQTPFIYDIVAQTGTTPAAHHYARGTTSSPIHEVAIHDLIPAIAWTSLSADRSCAEVHMTYWMDNSHWAVVDGGGLGHPLNAARASHLDIAGLENFGCLKAMHPDAPLKHLHRRQITAPKMRDVHFSNMSEVAQGARAWTARNVVSCQGVILIKVPEPHYVIGRDMRAGVYSTPRVSLGVPTGFVREKASHLEHLVSASLPEAVVTILDNIETSGFHHQAIHDVDTDIPELRILSPVSVNHAWHMESAAAGIDTILGLMRKRLNVMNNEDLLAWISLARRQEKGIPEESVAERMLLDLERLSLHLSERRFLVAEFSQALFATVYNAQTHQVSSTRKPAP